MSLTALTSAEISLPAEADGARVSDRIAVLDAARGLPEPTGHYAGPVAMVAQRRLPAAKRASLVVNPRERLCSWQSGERLKQIVHLDIDLGGDAVLSERFACHAACLLKLPCGIEVYRRRYGLGPLRQRRDILV